jgi:hypothetical protein
VHLLGFCEDKGIQVLEFPNFSYYHIFPIIVSNLWANSMFLIILEQACLLT